MIYHSLFTECETSTYFLPPIKLLLIITLKKQSYIPVSDVLRNLDFEIRAYQWYLPFMTHEIPAVGNDWAIEYLDSTDQSKQYHH